jgi:hypothetical protein
MPPAGRRVALDRFGPAARDRLRTLAELLGPARPAWIVGGAVRDALLGDAADDLDVAVETGAVVLARALAARVGGAFVVLDGGRGVARVPGAGQVDVADFRAADLAGDLAGRDFTVNALAAPVRELARTGAAAIEDPLGGVADPRRGGSARARRRRSPTIPFACCARHDSPPCPAGRWTPPSRRWRARRRRRSPRCRRSACATS